MSESRELAPGDRVVIRPEVGRSPLTGKHLTVRFSRRGLVDFEEIPGSYASGFFMLAPPLPGSMAFAAEDLYSAMSINAMVELFHGSNRHAGWWTDLKTGQPIEVKTVVPEKLCLIHSEISEAMEGHRKSSMDDKLPHRLMIEVELADAVIRIFDLAGALGLDLGGAIVEKRAFNATRSDHQLASRMAAGGKAY